jgi:hypothetical protein
MSLGFAVAATKLGAPIAEFLLKRYIGEGAGASGRGLIDIAASRISDAESQRLAARQFEDIGDKVVRRLLPIFENVEDSASEAVAHEVGLTLAGYVSAEFFLDRDLDPAKLGNALRSQRPLQKNMFSQAEVSLYERSLDEAIRYLVGIAESLPNFEAQAAATALRRLSRIGADLDNVLESIARIERFVQQKDTDETTRRYEGDYRQAIQRNLDYLELFGADISPESQHHSLSVGYVSLNITSSVSSKGADTHSADALVWLLAAGNGRLLIRGHAGSGKSTLLRWLAIETATGNYVNEQLLNDLLFNQLNKGRNTRPIHSYKILSEMQHRWRHITELIPFLIRLRECSSGRLPAPEDLPTLIANELGRPPVDWVRSALDDGKGLLLLDGVDEVPNQRRESIRQALEALIARYPNNQFVVSTRPEAVPEGWLFSAGFTEASINPMSPPDRAEFIRRWHAAVSDELARQGRPNDLSSLANELVTKLSENSAIARLATNPLLCAALCALHRDRHRKLPESQSELCEAVCQLLLHRRETQAGLQLSEFPREYRDLTYEQKRAIVQAVAHYMVRNDESVISNTDALEITRKTLRNFPSAREEDGEIVLKSLIERTGVLREQKPGTIDFVHNTIKEFLAAEIFVEARDYSTLAHRVLDDSWRQVVLFASATRERQFATRLVKRITDLANEKADVDLSRRLRLAAISCRYAALHMDSETVEKLSAIEKELVPPRSMNDAEALADSGDNVVPLLRYRRMSAKETAACVRTLRLVGTEAAGQMLESYVNDPRFAVASELAQAIEPLRLAAVRSRIERKKEVPFSISRQITDLTALSALAGLTRLSLPGARITECNELSGLTSLRSLDLSRSLLHSLNGLSPLTELEELNISFAPIEFLEPIKSLSKLIRLDLSGIRISDFGPVGYLHNLMELNLRNTNLSDLGLLSLCYNLSI